MTEVLRIQEVRGQLSGALVGFKLTTSPGGESVIVFADQKHMPGFRLGEFVAGISEQLEYGKSTVLNVDA